MKISIVTVCFNSAAHIADALRSVDMQTWPDIEHLVVDGASRDATLAVVQAHPQPWRRVVSESDHGIYDAMNKGIRAVTGDVIGFINSDDFYASPAALATVANAFADPKVQACWGDLCYVKRFDTSQVVRYWRSSAFSPGLFGRGWCPPHPTLFMRRAVYERFGTFDLGFSIAADVELMARMIEVKAISSVYIPQVLVHMRMGGTTNRSMGNIVRQNWEIWQAFRLLGIKVSPLSFLGGKFLSRAHQYMSRPRT